MTSITVNFTVNGAVRQASVDPRYSLADVLRDELAVTGVRLGCEQGACGACAVLIDGEPACSCLALGAEVDGCDVETVEYLATSGRIADLQEAFIEQGAFQCGYCTAGFLVLGNHIIERGLATSRKALIEALHTNICRCTGYQPIIDAILATATRRAAAEADRS